MCVLCWEGVEIYWCRVVVTNWILVSPRVLVTWRSEERRVGKECRL